MAQIKINNQKNKNLKKVNWKKIRQLKKEKKKISVFFLKKYRRFKRPLFFFRKKYRYFKTIFVKKKFELAVLKRFNKKLFLKRISALNKSKLFSNILISGEKKFIYLAISNFFFTKKIFNSYNIKLTFYNSLFSHFLYPLFLFSFFNGYRQSPRNSYLWWKNNQKVFNSINNNIFSLFFFNFKKNNKLRQLWDSKFLKFFKFKKFKKFFYYFFSSRLLSYSHLFFNKNFYLKSKNYSHFFLINFFKSYFFSFNKLLNFLNIIYKFKIHWCFFISDLKKLNCVLPIKDFSFSLNFLMGSYVHKGLSKKNWLGYSIHYCTGYFFDQDYLVLDLSYTLFMLKKTFFLISLSIQQGCQILFSSYDWNENFLNSFQSVIKSSKQSGICGWKGGMLSNIKNFFLTNYFSHRSFEKFNISNYFFWKRFKLLSLHSTTLNSIDNILVAQFWNSPLDSIFRFNFINFYLNIYWIVFFKFLKNYSLDFKLKLIIFLLRSFYFLKNVYFLKNILKRLCYILHTFTFLNLRSLNEFFYDKDEFITSHLNNISLKKKFRTNKKKFSYFSFLNNTLKKKILFNLKLHKKIKILKLRTHTRKDVKIYKSAKKLLLPFYKYKKSFYASLSKWGKNFSLFFHNFKKLWKKKKLLKKYRNKKFKFISKQKITKKYRSFFFKKKRSISRQRIRGFKLRGIYQRWKRKIYNKKFKGFDWNYKKKKKEKFLKNYRMSFLKYQKKSIFYKKTIKKLSFNFFSGFRSSLFKFQYHLPFKFRFLNFFFILKIYRSFHRKKNIEIKNLSSSYNYNNYVQLPFWEKFWFYKKKKIPFNYFRFYKKKKRNYFKKYVYNKILKSKKKYIRKILKIFNRCFFFYKKKKFFYSLQYNYNFLKNKFFMFSKKNKNSLFYTFFKLIAQKYFIFPFYFRKRTYKNYLESLKKNYFSWFLNYCFDNFSLFFSKYTLNTNYLTLADIVKFFFYNQFNFFLKTKQAKLNFINFSRTNFVSLLWDTQSARDFSFNRRKKFFFLKQFYFSLKFFSFLKNFIFNKFPTLVISLNNSKNILAGYEMIKLAICSISICNSHESNFGFTYIIPGNDSSPDSTVFFLNCFFSSVNKGFYLKKKDFLTSILWQK